MTTTASNDRLRLGSLDLQSRFLLAPLEGVSDIAFRRLCFQNGAAVTYTEMIRARGVAKRNKSTLDLIDTWDDDVVTGVQFLATGPAELQDALGALDELAASSHPHFKNIRAIDLNFGCPSVDVIKIGAGPAMLKRRSRLEAIFTVLSTWKKHTRLPVGDISAKIRTGLNQREQELKVYLPVAEIASAHLDHLVVHARHAKQRSRDLPTWSCIAEVKKAATIPVIGNGNVKTPADARRMFDETGCDGILIARAAVENPWCFQALTGRGSGIPAPVEIERAKAAWDDTAHKRATKPKYVEFHAANFQRLGHNGPLVDMPRNQHMS